MSEKKGRLSQRAGLTLPASRVKSTMRNMIGKRRLQKHAEIVVTAQTEYLLTQLLKAAAARSGTQHHIGATHIHEVLRDAQSNPLGNLIPRHIGGLY